MASLCYNSHAHFKTGSHERWVKEAGIYEAGAV